MAIDPYRVLGLSAGASAAEVKRAYRRLAKANHPDSAGTAALPRFLEIQRAYETLTAATWRPGMRRPSSGSSGAESWRADPARARSTSGAGAPPRGGTPGTRSSGTGRTAGDRGGASAGPEARGGTGRGGSAQAGPAGAAGASRSRTAGGSRPAGSDDGGPTGRRRPSKKATFGSTTYDEAREQADTSWSGASWYGPSSGEYWRVNPREYADPRKHGPEYLARAAARAAAAAERRARQGPGGVDADGSDGTHRSQPAGIPGSGAGRRARSAGAGPRARTATPGARPPTDSAARPGTPGSPRPEWTPPPRAAADDAAPNPGSELTSKWPALSIDLSPGTRRLVRAVIAWPPLGIAAAAVIGEATGCAAFEATCAAPADLYPWFAQAAILLVLLAFPVAAALSASGATYDRTYGPAALIGVLAVVWVLGVGAVLLRRAVTRGLP